MPLIRADVVMPYTTALPRDVTINTFHFGCTDVDAHADLATVLPAFYNTDHGDTDQALCYYIGETVSRVTNACRVKVYDAEEEGPPLAEYQWTLGAAASTPTSLPMEVAACLSYKSVPGIGIASRNRGRIFLGPLNTGGVLTEAGTLPIMTAQLCASMAAAGTYLAYNATLLADGLVWSVYSRVSGNVQPITEGWVDNEFDTQRRRQVEATQRVLWDAVIP